MPKTTKVLFVAAELSPLAKVGGLADVVGALPKSLYALGIDVRIVIPKYGIIDEKKYSLKKIASDISVPFKGKTEKISVYSTLLPGSQVIVYLIDHSGYLGYDGIYTENNAAATGTNREAERFMFFSRSSLEFFKKLNWLPDIVHCHDWHVGLTPVLLKILSQNQPELKKIKTLLTIHNLEYQGRYNAKEVFQMLGLKQDDWPSLSDQRQGDIISLQQAILTSDHLNTVSPTYAQEILTPEYNAGLADSLAKRKKDLNGILNGIDVEKFNPATDPDIISQFTSADLSGKEKCKADLQKNCGFAADPNTPILAVVSRLAEQKGIELFSAIVESLVKKDVQIVILGTGLPNLEQDIKHLSLKYPDKYYGKLAFDAHFAQKVYAGADIFLMPSKFEPCGLGQMIAMRYGTVPVVRATGGLKDTVTDYSPATHQGTGFVFAGYTSQELLAAIERALDLYQEPKKWHTVVSRIMREDFSWRSSAEKYQKLYHKLLEE